MDTPGAGPGQETAAGGVGRTGRPHSGQRGPVPGEDAGPFLWAGGLGLEVAGAGAEGLSAPREPGWPAFLCVRRYVCVCVTGLTSSACLSWTPPQRLLPAVTMGLVSPAVPTQAGFSWLVLWSPPPGLWSDPHLGSYSEVGSALRITSKSQYY